MDKKKIVVCGATGNQGGAVVNSLLERNEFEIIALSRNPESHNAKLLEARGIRVIKADLMDLSSLKKAFVDSWGVFGVTLAWSSKGKFVGIETEVSQGKNIVEACLENKIPHLVLSTGLTYKGHDEIPHGKSKMMIEEHSRKQNVPCTIVRPATFMNEIGGAMLPVKKGLVKGLCDHDVKMAWITWRDIGEFVSLIFVDHRQYIGKTIELFGDIASGDDICKYLITLTGKTWSYKPAPRFLLKVFAKEIYKMRLGFEIMGRPPMLGEWEKRLEISRDIFPEVIGIETYLKSRNFE